MDEKKKQFTLLEWLGYREFPLYEKARWLGHTLGFAIVAVAILMLVLAAYVLFQFTMAVTGPLEANGEAIRNIGFVVAALVGLPFIVWRAVVAQQQVNVAEQSHITDRISKAVEQLGAEKTVKRVLKDADGNPVFDIDGITPKTVETTEPNIEVRLGGIYALERISKDSLPDHIQIMEILCAYVRENAPASGAAKPDFSAPERPDDLDGKQLILSYILEKVNFFSTSGPFRKMVRSLKLRHDIQAAVTVIKRRGKRLRDHELAMVAEGQLTVVPLDLRGTCLQAADMSGGYFDGAQFDKSKLDGAVLDGAKLNRAVLSGAYLNVADLNKAELNGANLNGAELIGATLTRAELNGAWLIGAALTGADLAEAFTKLTAVKSTDLTECVDLSVDQVNSMFGDASTTLPDGMDRPQHWPQTDLEYEEFLQLWQAAKDKAGMS